VHPVVLRFLCDMARREKVKACKKREEEIVRKPEEEEEH
jgi:hypothetical protein